MRRGLLAAPVLALALLAGCGGGGGGGDGGSGPDGAASAEVAGWLADAKRYCPDARTANGDFRAAIAAVNGLVRTARERPGATVAIAGGTVTLRQALTDAADALRPCTPTLAGLLDGAVRTLP
jgi:hypothetical protein